MTPEDFFLFGAAFACAIWLYLPLLVAMHLLMPRAVIESYWQQPYFGPFELGMFSSAPYGPLRTQKLIAAMVFPGIAKKRGIDQGWPVPPWYLRAARALIAWGLLASSGFFAILAGLYVHMVAKGLAPSPADFDLKGKLMTAVFIACVVLLAGQRWYTRRSRPGRRRSGSK